MVVAVEQAHLLQSELRAEVVERQQQAGRCLQLAALRVEDAERQQQALLLPVGPRVGAAQRSRQFLVAHLRQLLEVVADAERRLP